MKEISSGYVVDIFAYGLLNCCIIIFQAAGNKSFSDFSGFKSTNVATFGKRSDDLAMVVAAQSAVVCVELNL